MVTANDDDGQDPRQPGARNITNSSAEIRYCEQDGAGDCDTHGAEFTVWFSLETSPGQNLCPLAPNLA